MENIILTKAISNLQKNGSKEITRELILPMNIRRVIAHGKVQEDSNKVAFEYGPMVYRAEEIDNKNQLLNVSISDNTTLKSEKRTFLSNMVIIIEGSVQIIIGKDDYKSAFIPYFL